MKSRMLVPSCRIVRKAKTAVSTSGRAMPVWVSARTERRSPTPMMPMSRSSHSHSVAFADRLSG